MREFRRLNPSSGEVFVFLQFLIKPLIEGRYIHAHFAELRFAAIEIGGKFLAEGFEPFPRRIADDAIEAGGLVGRVNPCAPLFAGRRPGGQRTARPTSLALPFASNQHGQKWRAKPPGSHDRFSPWKCSTKLARTFFRNASEVLKGNKYVVRLHAPAGCAGNLAASISLLVGGQGL